MPPQTDIIQTLDSSGLVAIIKQDDGLYNQLYPQFNANLDWVSKNCIAKPGSGEKGQ